jgi:AmiR/NasT family two-component response regulator
MDRPVTTPAATGVKASSGIFAAAANIADRERPREGRTVVVVGGRDSELMERAAALGIAHQVVSAETLEETIALVLKESQELGRLRALTTRLAQVERAKGILMERHKVSERDAHERMRRHARKLGLKLTAVAEARASSPR